MSPLLGVADYVRHILDLISTGDHRDLDSAFDLIERLHVEGDHDVWHRRCDDLGEY